MNYPETVKVVEVGPRDGLQNEKTALDTEAKLHLISQLADAGLKTIESGSFVSPKWVPQMAGSEEVFEAINSHIQPIYPNTIFSALTPNDFGMARAIECGVKEVAVFAAASESFSQKNINCSIKESLERFVPVMTKAHRSKIPVRGYVSCVLGCPYEGSIDPHQVAIVTQELLDMGCYEVSLGDTIGIGTAGHFKRLLDYLLLQNSVHNLAVHCHDTYGQALANICASLEYGIATVDSSVAGLGGCPYALNATGNVASEDVVYMLQGMGIATGIDLDKLVAVGQSISALLGKPTNSNVARARSAV